MTHFQGRRRLVHRYRFMIYNLSASVVLALAGGGPASADEGMWTLDSPPVEQIRKRYGVELTPDLLNHLRQSAVNFGASGSFVSGNGLMLTNHHVAASCIDRLSSPSRDLTRHGHLARTPAQELRCPGGTARVLMSIEDVTGAVQQAAAAGSTDEQKNARRKATIAELEATCRTASGLACEMVSLYSGSLYHLYRFKEWDDVRLVFAPEAQAANFGGDADNFVYPRFAFDFALLRVYEGGKPVHSTQHLSMASRPLAEGDPVFVIGHPGRTFRLRTLAQLKSQRDLALPQQLASAKAQQALLHAYSARSPEAARQALDVLFGVENWLKGTRGAYTALSTPAVMERKSAEEAEFRAGYARLGLEGDPWAQVEAAVGRYTARANELWAVGYGRRTLFEHAGHLVELSHERLLPEAQRLSAYRDAEIPAIERRLKADVPVYKDLEIARLAGQFEEAQQLLGAGHPFVQAVLRGATPQPAQGRPKAAETRVAGGTGTPVPGADIQAAAEALVRGSRLDQARERVALLGGGVAAIEASDDPLVRLARVVYPIRRELEKFEEEQIDTPIEQAAQRLGQARFAIHGKAVPPDATATLRLAYGRVAGYESYGVSTPWKTTLGGLYARADGFDNKPPFDLAPQVQRARARVDSRVPLNFVSTADITGGNSGSPVVNQRGEWVGLIFDGNLESLGGRYVYTDTQSRSVSVDARAILHALEHIYGAGKLAEELRGTPDPGTGKVKGKGPVRE